MAGTNLPNRAMREQISSALDLIIQVQRLSDGTRRIVSVTEVTGMEGEVVTTQEIYRFRRRGVTPEGKIVGAVRGDWRSPDVHRAAARVRHRATGTDVRGSRVMSQLLILAARLPGHRRGPDRRLPVHQPRSALGRPTRQCSGCASASARRPLRARSILRDANVSDLPALDRLLAGRGITAWLPSRCRRPVINGTPASFLLRRRRCSPSSGSRSARICRGVGRRAARRRSSGSWLPICCCARRQREADLAVPRAAAGRASTCSSAP